MFGHLNLILSSSTCSQSFKKICAWELLGANVLKLILSTDKSSFQRNLGELYSGCVNITSIHENYRTQTLSRTVTGDQLEDVDTIINTSLVCMWLSNLGILGAIFFDVNLSDLSLCSLPKLNKIPLKTRQLTHLYCSRSLLHGQISMYSHDWKVTLNSILTNSFYKVQEAADLYRKHWNLKQQIRLKEGTNRCVP